MARMARQSLPAKRPIQDRKIQNRDEVSTVEAGADRSTEEERDVRETLAEYFAILREWDLKLRENESSGNPDFRQP
jgi:hypothetical protein